jgi:hypothetical protein
MLSSGVQLRFHIRVSSRKTAFHFFTVLDVFISIGCEELFRVLPIARDDIRLMSYVVHYFFLFPWEFLWNFDIVPCTIRVILLFLGLLIGQTLFRQHIFGNLSIICINSTESILELLLILARALVEAQFTHSPPLFFTQCLLEERSFNND